MFSFLFENNYNLVLYLKHERLNNTQLHIASNVIKVLNVNFIDCKNTSATTLQCKEVKKNQILNFGRKGSYFQKTNYKQKSLFVDRSGTINTTVH